MRTARVARLLGACAAVLWFAGAAAQVRIGVIASATGPTSGVGIPQRNTAQLLPRRIGDLDVEYLVFDDASDPTQTVQLVRKLLDAQVDAIIGPSGSPNAMAVLPMIAESGTPMLAPVGTPAVVVPMDAQKRWVFKTSQNDDLICAALIGHMVRTGIKTLGFIGFNDPYGESWAKVLAPMAQQAGISIVASERYARTDQSVIGQVARLLAAHPDAVLVAGTSGPAALPQITLTEQGYKGVVYQTHGAAAPEFIRLGGAKVEGAVMAASIMLVLDQVAAANPARRVAEDYIAAYEKQFGARPATFGANVYDAGILLQHALPDAAKGGRPGSAAFRSALRDALERSHELVGTQGVYNMTAADHSGFDRRGRVLMTLTHGSWHLLDE